MGAYSWNEDFNSETTACAESTIAELYNRVGDGCAVRLWTNSLSRLAYPRMPQRLLRKGGTAPHSCRVLRFQRMANYTDDRLADWNSRPAFPSTREAKGQQMTPKRPRDPNQLAKSIIDIAPTGEKPDRDPTPEEQGKDPAAVALGKKGGKARADGMTANRRQS